MPAPALAACPACAGFVPAARPTCPHCDAPVAPSRGRLARAVARLAGAASVVTLMACYGMHPRHLEHPGCVDADGDGACATVDCDDHDPAYGHHRCPAPPEGADEPAAPAGAAAPAPTAIATDPP